MLLTVFDCNLQVVDTEERFSHWILCNESLKRWQTKFSPSSFSKDGSTLSSPACRCSSKISPFQRFFFFKFFLKVLGYSFSSITFLCECSCVFGNLCGVCIYKNLEELCCAVDALLFLVPINLEFS